MFIEVYFMHPPVQLSLSRETNCKDMFPKRRIKKAARWHYQTDEHHAAVPRTIKHRRKPHVPIKLQDRCPPVSSSQCPINGRRVMQLKPSTHNISIHFPHKLSHSLITFSLGGISTVTEIWKNGNWGSEVQRRWNPGPGWGDYHFHFGRVMFFNDVHLMIEWLLLPHCLHLDIHR